MHYLVPRDVDLVGTRLGLVGVQYIELHHLHNKVPGCQDPSILFELSMGFGIQGVELHRVVLVKYVDVRDAFVSFQSLVDEPCVGGCLRQFDTVYNMDAIFSDFSVHNLGAVEKQKHPSALRDVDEPERFLRVLGFGNSVGAGDGGESVKLDDDTVDG